MLVILSWEEDSRIKMDKPRRFFYVRDLEHGTETDTFFIEVVSSLTLLCITPVHLLIPNGS
jgi:hypothetical protein